MTTFFDSSAFAKRYIEEPGSAEVERICREADLLALSVIAAPEILSALNRRVRERSLGRETYRRVKARLIEDVRDAMIVDLTPSVVADAIAILERAPVRAMDAFHVACAKQWGADLFVSADDRQLRAARAVGLNTRRV